MTLCSNLGFLAAACLLALSGCTADIGDACSTSTNCSSSGDRACDTTSPGGYCTIFNCEPDTCPSEAGCIAFRQQVSLNPACKDPTDTRMMRTFCMVHCSDNSDCRNGYVCGDVSAVDNPWGASLADRNNRDGRVCIVPPATASEGTSAAAGYCQWYGQDAGTGLPDPYDASAPDAS
jgi:hypothetical protein